MMVVPLVVASVMCGILGLGDVRKLGKPGITAVGYYLCTTVLALVVGLIVVNLINPGEQATAESSPAAAENDSEEVMVTAADKSHLLEKLASQTGHAAGEDRENLS